MADKEEQGLFSQAGDVLGSVWDNMSMLDKAAIGLSPVPILGDVVGFAADATNMINNPDERTWTNAGLMAAGLLPWVPPAASKRAWELTTHNMPNDLKTFYSGGAGKLAAAAQVATHGPVNALKQSLSPSGQALWRTERISKTLQNELRKSIDKLPEARKNIEKAVASGDEVAMEAAKKEFSRLSKVIEGQKSQSFLFGEQYGKQVGPLETAARGTHIGSGDFKPESFHALVDQVADISTADKDLAFKAIGQLQTTTPGVGKMVMKKAKSALGAGDLTGVVSRGERFKGVKKIFEGRPTMASFGSYKKFEDALMTGLNPKQRTKLEKLDVMPKLKKAFHGNKALSEAGSVEEFSKALKKAKIKLTPTQVKHAFKKLPKKGFSNNKELIDAMDEQGIEIYNRAKALNGDPVIIQNSLSTGAFELGHSNVMSMVKPDGSTINFLSDKNDFGPINAPRGGNMITVSTPIEINLTKGKASKLEQRRTKAINKAEFNKVEDAARATVDKYGVDPRTVDTPHLNIAQKASARAIADAAPKAATQDYLNAAKVAGYLGGSGALKSGLFAVRQGPREDDQ